MARLFGTDGVRGRANIGLKPEFAFKLGRAHGYLIKEEFQASAGAGVRPVIAVGRDTRVSGPMLQYAYICGLVSSGADALVLDVIPTPGAAWAVRHYGVQGGCVISASHNPFYDNGLKLIGADGFKLSDAREDQIEELIASADTLPRADGADLGVIRDGRGAQRAYADYLVSAFHAELKGLKLVLDCANGASSALAGDIFSRLGAEVTVINAEPDGININTACGSTHPEALQKKVVEIGADLGLAFDGDADRCLACDEKGQMIDGDHMLMLFAQKLRADGKLPHDRLVTTVMANLGLENACREAGLDMARTAVGDRYVLEEMRRSGSVLGGEQSGHIIFLDHATTGDGMLTGTVLAHIVNGAGRPLSELSSVVVKQPQYMLNVKVKDKHNWKQHPAVAAAADAVEEKLKGRGRLLVRPSGTESLVRVMAEGPDQAELAELVGSICDALRKYCPCEE